MSGKKMKKIALLVWPGKLKTWWSFLLILLILGANKATLREWSRPGTLPSGPLRCVPCSYILTTVTKFWVAQNKDFFNIWGRSVGRFEIGEYEYEMHERIPEGWALLLQ